VLESFEEMGEEKEIETKIIFKTKGSEKCFEMGSITFGVGNP